MRTAKTAMKRWPNQTFLFPSVCEHAWLSAKQAEGWYMCWALSCRSSHSQPTVLRWIALLLCPDISGRLHLAKEPSGDEEGEELSGEPVFSPLRSGPPSGQRLIASQGESVVTPVEGGKDGCVM